MKLRNLILFGLLFSIGVLNAQTDFRPGYIVNTSNDTLYGNIDYRGDLLMSGLCKFRDKQNVIKDYSPSDITAFRFIDSKYYVSREINGRLVFLEYLIKGKVNIYYMRDESENHYYLDKEDVQLIELPYEEGIKYVDDIEIFYESKKHIGILNYYMQDAPEFQSRIKSVKKPEHHNLVKLAEDYHNTVCEGEACIIYEKPVPFIKILPEFIGGLINLTTVKEVTNKLYTHTGIIGHIWMPRTSEKIYFRTGVLFSQLDIDGEKNNSYKIPVQLEYIYPKGFFRPRLAYGFNFYMPTYRTVSLDVGANFKLSENFFLSATSDFEFNPIILIVPKDMFSYSVKLGLFLSFN